MRPLGRHAHRLAQGRVEVDGLADVDRIRAHPDGDADFADHVADAGADDDPVGFGVEDELDAAGVVGDGLQ